jgi:hypothetical protein
MLQPRPSSWLTIISSWCSSNKLLLLLLLWLLLLWLLLLQMLLLEMLLKLLLLPLLLLLLLLKLLCLGHDWMRGKLLLHCLWLLLLHSLHVLRDRCIHSCSWRHLRCCLHPCRACQQKNINDMSLSCLAATLGLLADTGLQTSQALWKLCSMF